jgi:hypothetical protein
LCEKFTHPIFAIRSKKKSIVLRKNNQIKTRLLRFKKINFKVLKNKFGQNKKGSYFCTPKSKMGGQKRPKDL